GIEGECLPGVLGDYGNERLGKDACLTGDLLILHIEEFDLIAIGNAAGGIGSQLLQISRSRPGDVGQGGQGQFGIIAILILEAGGPVVATRAAIARSIAGLSARHRQDALWTKRLDESAPGQLVTAGSLVTASAQMDGRPVWVQQAVAAASGDPGRIGSLGKRDLGAVGDDEAVV